MRSTTVRFSHTNRSAIRRRSGFAATFRRKQTAPLITLVESTEPTSAPNPAIKAA